MADVAWMLDTNALSELIRNPADQHHADIRTSLEREGKPIGSHDLLIAAHTRLLGLTLVTHNLREFSRMPGLAVVDWMAAAA